MFDPTLPQQHTLADAAQMRSQLNGLKALIDALLTVTAAQVDGVTTLEPGNPANVSVSVVGNSLHLTFDIPRGNDGAQGAQGAAGADGSPGAAGPQGQPGEVSQTDLNNGLLNTLNQTSSHTNNVTTLDNPFPDPDVETLRQKVNEVILNGRR